MKKKILNLYLIIFNIYLLFLQLFKPNICISTENVNIRNKTKKVQLKNFIQTK